MSTAIAESPPKQLTIKERLQSPAFIQALAEIVPQHCKPERMARIAITALTRTPKLAECDQASFFRCLMDLSQWGLEPDGRRAHLIPFENRRRNCTECQLIIDYKGYVELAYRSGVVKNIHADVVREGDIFDYSTGRIVKHVPHFLRRDADKPAKPGEVFAAYCVVELDGGTVKTEVLSHEEIEGIRKRSRAGNNGPWVTDWCEMAKKTAFRRATKWLPLSAEIRDAFERDDDVIEGIASPSRAAAMTVDDLSTLLKGGSPEDHDSAPQDDGPDYDRPQTTPEPDTNLLDDARAGFAACETVGQVGTFAAEVLPKVTTDAERHAIEGMERDAELRIREGRGERSNKPGKQKELVK
jgi:recombination protein RecT